MERIETTVLRNLIYNEEFSRKVIPFINLITLNRDLKKVVFEEITKFIVKYGSTITIEALNIETDNRTDLTEAEVKEVRDINNSLEDKPADYQWLMDTTEKWCRDRAIYLALMESIALADGQDDAKKKGMLFLLFSLTLWQFL